MFRIYRFHLEKGGAIFTEETVDMLIRLGLTCRQAKVYLSLIKLELATVKNISAFSKVPRQHIYEVISSLQELGLTEKAITKPVMFRATPIHNAVSTLIEQKSKECRQFQADAKEVLSKLEGNNAKTAPPAMEPSFILIPGSETIPRLMKAVANAQISYDSIVPWHDHAQIIFRYASEFKVAMKRGVTFRYIKEKPKDKKISQKIIEEFKQNNSWREKSILTRNKATLSLIDKKELFFATSPISPSKNDVLWSNNPCIVGMVQEYFEMKWRESLDEKT